MCGRCQEICREERAKRKALRYRYKGRSPYDRPPMIPQTTDDPKAVNRVDVVEVEIRPHLK